MLTVALLGQLSVQLEGQPADVSLRPVQLLLVYLLLHRGVSHRRERLSGLLWPDYTEESARKNLRNTVYRLRKIIGDDYLIAYRTTLAFNTAAPLQLDVAQLEVETDPADIEALIRTVEAYQGELLPGFYEDWVLVERERLRALFEQWMQELLDALEVASRWKASLTWGEHWIAQG